MKIQLQTTYASPHCTAQPGTILDVSEEEGRELIAGRYATEVPEAPAPLEADEAAPVETAEAPSPAETATHPAAKSRRVRG